MTDIERIKQRLVENYVAKRRKSQEYYEKAKHYLPGADTRSATFFEPFPFVTDSAQGCKIVDLDGNEYYDFMNNYTSLAHGHAFAPVVAAIQEQAAKGTAHGTNFEAQYEVAKLLCDRVAALDEVRFANSASEAVMFAMRAARAFTGKDGFLKINGGYNGATDFTCVNSHVDLEHGDHPQPLTGRGIPACLKQDTYVAPFNNLTVMEEILKAHNDKIAAIIMEPMMGGGGCIMPEDGYLKGVRALADKYNVLLILDETITLRFSEGGMEKIYDVRPDLFTTGKTIGGGLPVGAFGGRRDIMEMFNPTRPDSIEHTGTFCGNAITMAAGVACMRHFTQNEINRINLLGERLKSGLNQIFADLGVNGCVQGFGSVMQINNYSAVPARTAEEFAISKAAGDKPNGSISDCVHLSMVTKGVMFARRGMVVLSTAMDDSTVDFALNAFRETYQELRPLLP